MFNKLFANVEDISDFRSIVQNIEDLIQYFDEEFEKGTDARDAAIDAIVEILQAHKSKPKA